MINTKISIVLLIILLFSCAGNKEVVKESSPVVYDESFNPVTLDDEDIVITADRVKNTARLQGSQTNQEKPSGEIMGYRVQIIALTDQTNASLTEQEARERFELNGYKTYYVYEAPFFKIRVGDCLDRKCAEKLRELARDVYNYKEAQIIRTKINVESASEEH